MSNGLPKHIRELADSAAGHIIADIIFGDAFETFQKLPPAPHAHEPSTFIYTSPSGRAHHVGAYTKVVKLSEAFNEIFVASAASAMNLPVAPVVFNSVGKNAYLLHSIRAHTHAMTVEDALDDGMDHISPDTPREYYAPDLAWLKMRGNFSLPPQTELEGILFHQSSRAISSLLPFINWIGGADLHSSNLIIDGRKLLRNLNGTARNPHEGVGFYVCDFTSNPLQGRLNQQEFVPLSAPEILAPSDVLSNFLRHWPTILRTELSCSASMGEQGWWDVDPAYPAKLIHPLFAPLLDKDAMHDTISYITALDSTVIREETQRIVEQMSLIIEDAQDIARLKKYAAHMTEIFIMRRDVLAAHTQPLMNFEADLLHPENPFEPFAKIAKASVSTLKQQRKATQRPNAAPRKPRNAGKTPDT